MVGEDPADYGDEQHRQQHWTWKLFVIPEEAALEVVLQPGGPERSCLAFNVRLKSLLWVLSYSPNSWGSTAKGQLWEGCFLKLLFNIKVEQTKIKQIVEGKEGRIWCWWGCWGTGQPGMTFLIQYLWHMCKGSDWALGNCFAQGTQLDQVCRDQRHSGVTFLEKRKTKPLRGVS